MHNWNYDNAIAFVESIPDPVSRGLTKLFLDRLILFVAQKQGYPESDFDLLFFVRAISTVTCEPELLRMVLEGNELDKGWGSASDFFKKF